VIGENFIIIFILMTTLYCLLTTLNTNQIPLNKQLKTTQLTLIHITKLNKQDKDSFSRNRDNYVVGNKGHPSTN